MLNKNFQNCYCGSEQTYGNCCGQYIEQKQLPETPEQLMRSRYSAYVLKNEIYLLQSWHESTRPAELDLKNDSTHWMALKIISTTDNTVHFLAYFTQGMLNKDKIYALTEESHFINAQSWLYLNGDNVKTVQLSKNMPCPCQSGKKYKRCCEKEVLSLKKSSFRHVLSRNLELKNLDSG